MGVMRLTVPAKRVFLCLELLKKEWNENTSSAVPSWQAFHLKPFSNSAFWSYVTWACVPPSPELWESIVCSSPWLGSSSWFLYCLQPEDWGTSVVQLCPPLNRGRGGRRGESMVDQNKNWGEQLGLSFYRESFKPVGFWLEIYFFNKTFCFQKISLSDFRLIFLIPLISDNGFLRGVV